ncbi:hypothetical protein, partial [Longimycelium tulufanense]|uniref:hypothetical protein n=1 Tax=Longimycelium tulufanense TaxID=907463 RepID=UPI001E594A17
VADMVARLRARGEQPPSWQPAHPPTPSTRVEQMEAADPDAPTVDGEIEGQSPESATPEVTDSGSSAGSDVVATVRTGVLERARPLRGVLDLAADVRRRPDWWARHAAQVSAAQGIRGVRRMWDWTLQGVAVLPALVWRGLTCPELTAELARTENEQTRERIRSRRSTLRSVTATVTLAGGGTGGWYGYHLWETHGLWLVAHPAPWLLVGGLTALGAVVSRVRGTGGTAAPAGVSEHMPRGDIAAAVAAALSAIKVPDGGVAGAPMVRSWGVEVAVRARKLTTDHREQLQAALVPAGGVMRVIQHPSDPGNVYRLQLFTKAPLAESVTVSVGRPGSAQLTHRPVVATTASGDDHHAATGRNILFVGLNGSGKTGSLETLMEGETRSPRVRAWVIDQGGSPAWRDWAPLLVDHAILETRDGETIEQAQARNALRAERILRGLRAAMMTRVAELRARSKKEWTPELGLTAWRLYVDEANQFPARLLDEIAGLAQIGRKYGFRVRVAAQQITSAKDIPRGLLSELDHRYVHAATTETVDQVVRKHLRGTYSPDQFDVENGQDAGKALHVPSGELVRFRQLPDDRDAVRRIAAERAPTVATIEPGAWAAYQRETQPPPPARHPTPPPAAEKNPQGVPPLVAGIHAAVHATDRGQATTKEIRAHLATLGLVFDDDTSLWRALDAISSRLAALRASWGRVYVTDAEGRRNRSGLRVEHADHLLAVARGQQ